MPESMIECICETCAGTFFRRVSEHKRNPSRFCCKKCYGANLAKLAVENFWNRHVKTKKGCWEWTDFKNKDGYGVARLNGEIRRAHVHAFILKNGPFKEGLHVLHKCDNPPCVNPDHLFLGTHQDNMADMVAKGRHYSKLSTDNIQTIKEMKHSTSFLAQKFGVSESTIRSYLPKTRNRQPS